MTQMDSHPSAIGAFLEGVLHCKPQPPVRSCVLKVLSHSFPLPSFSVHGIPITSPFIEQYLGKTHNFWHGSALLLEDRAASGGELQREGPREPPAYNGLYSEQLLDPFKQVRFLRSVTH